MKKKRNPVNVKAIHPGILKVPAGKKVTQLGLSHFRKLAKKKGHAAISRALANLERWNKRKNTSLSRWARRMNDKLRKSFEK